MRENVTFDKIQNMTNISHHFPAVRLSSVPIPLSCDRANYNMGPRSSSLDGSCSLGPTVRFTFCVWQLFIAIDTLNGEYIQLWTSCWDIQSCGDNQQRCAYGNMNKEGCSLLERKDLQKLLITFLKVYNSLFL